VPLAQAKEAMTSFDKDTEARMKREAAVFTADQWAAIRVMGDERVRYETELNGAHLVRAQAYADASGQNLGTYCEDMLGYVDDVADELTSPQREGLLAGTVYDDRTLYALVRRRLMVDLCGRGEKDWRTPLGIEVGRVLEVQS